MAAQKGQQAVAVAQGTLPQGYDLEDILQDAGAGANNMATGDIGIPYLAVLQTNSPQVNPGHAKYVEGAQAGMFYNTATGEVYDGRKEGIILIPCAYERKFVEWKDRDSGEGGFVGEHPIESNMAAQQTQKNAKGRPCLPNGNMIYETAYQYCLLRNPSSGRLEQVVVTLKSTMLKKNRRWNNQILSATIPGTNTQAPRWMFPYLVKTQLESKGENSWFNIDPERQEEPVSVDEYRMGKEFFTLHAQGLVQRAAEPDADAASEPASDAGKAGDDEIPY